MTHKFKDGDIVKLNASFQGAAKPGALAKVEGYEFSGGFEYVVVTWDRTTNDLASTQMDGDYYERDFDLVETKGIFIVIDEDDNITAEWLTLENAERDARLSAEQAGVGFAVYQRIVSFGVKTEVVETRG